MFWKSHQFFSTKIVLPKTFGAFSANSFAPNVFPRGLWKKPPNFLAQICPVRNLCAANFTSPGKKKKTISLWKNLCIQAWYIHKNYNPPPNLKPPGLIFGCQTISYMGVTNLNKFQYTPFSCVYSSQIIFWKMHRGYFRYSAGMQIREYKIERHLNSGQFGDVYSAVKEGKVWSSTPNIAHH